MGPKPDVVVIGGGIAGVSIGYQLAAHRRVTVVETEASFAGHSTGRSAVMYVPSHGRPPVRALINASDPRFAVLPEKQGGPRCSARARRPLGITQQNPSPISPASRVAADPSPET